MGIEGYDGNDYLEKEAAEFQMNKYEARVGEADSVDQNFGKFEDGGLHRVGPYQLEDLRGSGPPDQYGDLSPHELQQQFDYFYANDQTQAALDQGLINASFGGEVVTVTQDGSKYEVSDGHEMLRFAQETNQPYVPVHHYSIRY